MPQRTPPQKMGTTKVALPLWTGLAASVLTAATLAWAASKEPQSSAMTVVVAPVLASGMIASSFAALRLRALLTGSMLGLFVGCASSAQLLAQPMAHPFYPVLSTVGLFALLGFLIGGLVEFAMFIHFLAHGGTPSEYPPV